MTIFLLGNEINFDKISGPDRVALNLFRELYQSSENCRYLTIQRQKKWKSTAKMIENAELSKRQFNSSIVIGLIRLVYEILISNPDILLFTHWNTRLILFLFLRPFIKAKFVHICHGVLPLESAYLPVGIKRNIYLFIDKLQFYIVDKIVSISKIELQQIHENYKLEKDKVTIIPNGVSRKFFAHRRREFNYPLNIFLFPGWSSSTKHLDTILSSTKIERDRDKLVINVICNRYSPVINHNLHNVFLYERLRDDEYIKFLMKQDVFININGYEPFSLVTLESMASGMLVVMFKNVGISDYIVDKESGLLFSNEFELRTIIENLVNNRIDLKSITEGSIKVANSLTWERISEQYQEIFRKLIK